jgi:hypothetical protein
VPPPVTLVKSKQGKPFQGFIKESIFFIHDVGKEDVWGFTAQLQGHRDDVLGGVLHNLLTHFRGARKCDFGDAF